MKRRDIIISMGVAVFAAASLMVAQDARACGNEKAQVTVTKMTIKEAVKAKPTFVDANGAQTRAKFGVLPGAVLLTSYAEFKVNELPKDKSKKLAFYCANEQCSASTVSAKRAVSAGYLDVAVIPAGVMGWKSAGNKTTPVTKSKKSS